MPVEAERLGVERGESEVYARLARYLQRIHQVVFIESCADTGQGADKLIGEEGDVVLVNVHVLEDFVDGCLHALFGEKFVDTGLFAPFHPLFFSTGRFPVIVRSEQFAGGDGENRLSGDGRGVYVFGEEIKFAVEPFLLFLFVEVIQREGGFLVTLALPEIFFVRRIVVAAFNHPADKLYGGIVFFTVVLAFGFHYDFGEVV